LGTHRSGILRADWLEKHQSRVPAVAIVIVSRDEACGDPSSWAALAARLDAVRSAAKRRAVPVVVALMTSATRGALPDDRSAMVARHAGTERGCIVTCDVDDGPAAFQFLAPVVSTQASAFYAATAQRRMAAYAQNNLPSVDLNLRAAFKVAVLAEQRGDWEAAARLYREAYSYFPQVAVAGAAPLQRFLEVRAVAEVVNYRVRE